MGKFSFQVSPEFINKLGQLADVDKYAPAMIDESMPIVERNLKSELAKHKRTGDMLDSVKKTKSKKTKNGGYYAVVRPTGTDEKGVRNMEKLAALEFGTSKGQDATPVLTKVINDSRPTVEAKMQEVFKREVIK